MKLLWKFCLAQYQTTNLNLLVVWILREILALICWSNFDISEPHVICTKEVKFRFRFKIERAGGNVNVASLPPLRFENQALNLGLNLTKNSRI